MWWSVLTEPIGAIVGTLSSCQTPVNRILKELMFSKLMGENLQYLGAQCEGVVIIPDHQIN